MHNRFSAHPKRALLEPRTISILLSLTLVGSLYYQWWSDPQHQVSAGMRGAQTNNIGQIKRAVEALESHSAYRAQHDYLQAFLKLRDGQPEEAYKLAIGSKNHPDIEIEARVLAGEAAYQMGAAGNAKLLWEEALSRDPYCIAAHQWLGALYFDLGAMDNAIIHLKTVSQLSPEDPRPDRLMGLINLDYERPEVAIPHYLETLKRAPNQPEVESVWLELAECQIKQREFQEAFASLQNCGDSASKKRLLAECQMNLGAQAEAKKLAEEALQAEPENLDVLQLNAEIALVDGDVEQAAEFLQKGVNVDPYDHRTRTMLAQVLGRLGLNDESTLHSQKAEELQQLWQRFSDLQIDAINQKTNAEIRLEIGRLAQQLGRPALADSWYQAALAIDPSLKGVPSSGANSP